MGGYKKKEPTEKQKALQAEMGNSLLLKTAMSYKPELNADSANNTDKNQNIYNTDETKEMQEQRLYDNQSTGEAILTGAENFGINATSSFIGNTAGVVAGAVNAMVNGKGINPFSEENVDAFINNPINKYLAEISESFNQDNPVYSDPQNSSLLDDVTSAKFFSDVIGSAGYTAGGMASAYTIGKLGSAARNGLLKSAVKGSTKEFDEFLKSGIADAGVREAVKNSALNTMFKGSTSLTGAAMGRAYESSIEAAQAGTRAEQEMKASLSGRTDLSDIEKEKMIDSAKKNAQLTSFGLNMMLGFSDMTQSAKMFNTFGGGVEKVGKWWKEGLKQFAQEGGEEYLQNRIEKIAVDNQFTSGAAGKILNSFATLLGGAVDREAQLAAISGGLAGSPMGIYAGAKNYDKQQKTEAENKELYAKLSSQLNPNEKIALDKNLKYAELEQQKTNGRIILSALNNLGAVEGDEESVKIPNSEYTLGSLKEMSISDPARYSFESEKLKKEAEISIKTASNAQLSETVFAAIDTGNLDNLKLELEAISKSSNEELSRVIGEEVTNDNKEEKFKAMSIKIDKAEKIYGAIKNNIAGASPQEQREAAMISSNIELLSTMRMKELHVNPLNLDLASLNITTTLADFQDSFNKEFSGIKEKNSFTKKQVMDSEDDSALAKFKEKAKDSSDDDIFKDSVKISAEEEEMNKKSFMSNVVKAVDDYFGPGKQKEKQEAISAYASNIEIHNRLTKEINAQRVQYQKTLNPVEWNKQKKSQEKRDAALVKSVEKPLAQKTITVDDVLSEYGLSSVAPELKTEKLAAAFETFFNLNEDRSNSFGVNFDNPKTAIPIIKDIIQVYSDSADDNYLTGAIFLRKVIEKSNLIDGNNYWKSELPADTVSQAETILSTLGDRQQRLANPIASDGIGITPVDLYIYAQENKNTRGVVDRAVEKAENTDYSGLKKVRRSLLAARNYILAKRVINEKGQVWIDAGYVPAVSGGVYPYKPSLLITSDARESYISRINSAIKSLDKMQAPEVIDSEARKAIVFVIESFDGFTGTADNPKPDQEELKLAIKEYENLLITGKKSQDAGDFFFEKIDGQNSSVQKISLPVYSDKDTKISKDVYIDKADQAVALVYVKDGKKHTLSFNRTKYYTSQNKSGVISSPEVDKLMSLFNGKELVPLEQAMDLKSAMQIRYNYANEYLGSQTATVSEIPDMLFYGPKTITTDTITQKDGNVIAVNPTIQLKGSNGAPVKIDVQSTQVGVPVIKELSKMIAGVSGRSEISRLRSIVESIYVKGITTENMSDNVMSQIKDTAFIGQMVSQIVNKESKSLRYDFSILETVNEMAEENPDFFVSAEAGQKLISQLESDVSKPTDQIPEQTNKSFYNSFIKREYVDEMIEVSYGKIKAQIDDMFPGLSGIHLGINVAQEKGSDQASAKLVVIPYKKEEAGRSAIAGGGFIQKEQISYYPSTVDGEKFIQGEYFLDSTVGDPTSKKITGLEAEGDYVVSGDTVLSYLNKNGLIRNAIFPNVETSKNPTREMVSDALSKTLSPIDVKNPIAGNKVRGIVKVNPDFKSPVDTLAEKGIDDHFISPEESAARDIEQEKQAEGLEDLFGGLTFKIDTGSNKLKDKKSLSKARTWVSRNLPSGISMKEFDDFTARAYRQQGVLGKYVDNMILLSDEAGGSVLYHEAFHAVFNAILSKQDRDHFLSIAKDEIGEIPLSELKTFAAQHKSRENMSLVDLENLYLEEYMADQFAEYKITKDAQPWWKQLWDGIIEWLGFAKVSGSKIKDLFYKIDTGVFAKSSIINGSGNDILFKVINREDGTQIPVSESDDIIKSFASYFQYSKNLNSKDALKFFRPENFETIRASVLEFLDMHEEVYEKAVKKRNSLDNPAQFDINVFNDLKSRIETIQSIDASSVNSIIELMMKERESIFDITSNDLNPVMDDPSYSSDEQDDEKATLNDFDASAGEFSITPETISVKRLFSNMPIEDFVLKSGINSLEISDEAKKLVNNNLLFAKFNNGDAMYAQAMSTLSDSDTFEEFLAKLDVMISYPEWAAIKNKIRKNDGEPTNFAHLLRKATNYYYVDSSFVKEGTKASVKTTGEGSTALYSATITLQKKINGGIPVSKMLSALKGIQKPLSMMRAGSPEIAQAFNNNRKVFAQSIKNIGINIDPGLISFLASSHDNETANAQKNSILDALERYVFSIDAQYSANPASFERIQTVAQAVVLPGINKSFENLVKITAKYNKSAPLVSIDRFAGKSIWNYVRKNHIVARAKAINNANDISDLTDTRETIAYAPYLRDIDLLKQGNKNEDITGINDKQRVSLHVFRGSEKEDKNNIAFKEMSPAMILQAQMDMFFYAGGNKRFFMPYVIERKNTQYVYGVESPYIHVDEFNIPSSTLFTDESEADSPLFSYKISDTAVDIYYQMFLTNIDQIISNKENKDDFYAYRNDLQNIIKYLDKYKAQFVSNKEQAIEKLGNEVRDAINSNLRKAFDDFFIMLQDESIVKIGKQTKASGALNRPIHRYLPTEITDKNEMTDFNKKGNHKEKIKDYLSFFLESMIANQSLDHVTMGDDRQWNINDTKKSTEDNSSAAKINKSKRMAGAAASYSGLDMFGQYKYSFGKKVALSPDEQQVFTAVKIPDTFSYVKGAETYSDSYGNYEFIGPDPENKSAVKEFKAFQDSMRAQGYNEVAITDGQAYQDINRLRNWMISDNKIRNEKDEKLIDKIAMDREDLTKSEWNYIIKNTNVHLNSIKDIYYDGDTYLKESTTLLIRQITSVKETSESVKDSLESMYAASGNTQREFKLNGIDYVKDSANGNWYYSAPKEFMGQMLDTRKLHERLNQMQRIGATHMFHASCEKHGMSKPGGIFVLENSKHGKQQETPSGHDHVVDGTQLQSLVMAAIADTDMIGGKSGKFTKEEILKAQVAIREISFDKIFSDILLKSDNTEDRLNIEKLYSKIKQSNVATGKDVIAQLFDNIDGQYVPKSMNIVSKNLRDSILSLVNNKVLKQSVFGDKFYCVSAYGFEISEKKDGKLKSRPLKIHSGEKPYSEVVIPVKDADMYGLKIGDAIPEDILFALGVRIPTESAHSVIPMKIVAFLPPYMGSQIIVPSEFVLYSGMDFDIDALYVNMTDYDKIVTPEGVMFEKVKYSRGENGINDSELFADYAIEMLENSGVKNGKAYYNREIEKTGGFSLMNNPVASRTIMKVVNSDGERKYPATIEEWKKMKEKVISSRGLKNKQLDLRISSFTSQRADGTNPQMEAAIKPADVDGLTSIGKQIARFMGTRLLSGLNNTVTDTYQQQKAQRTGKPLIDVAIAQVTGLSIALSYQNNLSPAQTVNIEYSDGKKIPTNGKTIYDLEMFFGENGEIVFSGSETNETRLNAGSAAAAAILDDSKNATSFSMNYTKRTLSASFGGYLLGVGRMITGLINNNPVIFSLDSLTDSEFKSYINDLNFIAFAGDTLLGKNQDIIELYKSYKSYMTQEQKDLLDDQIDEAKSKYLKKPLKAQDVYAYISNKDGRNNLSSYGSPLDIPSYTLSEKEFDKKFSDQEAGLLIKNIDSDFAKNQLHILDQFSRLEKLGGNLTSIQQAYTIPLKGFDQNKAVDFDKLIGKIPEEFGAKEYLTKGTSLISSVKGFSNSLFEMMSKTILRSSKLFDHIGKSVYSWSKDVDEIVAKEKIYDIVTEYFVTGHAQKLGLFDTDFVSSLGTDPKNKNHRAIVVSNVNSLIDHATKRFSADDYIANIIGKEIEAASILFGYNGNSVSGAIDTIKSQYASTIGNKFLEKLEANYDLDSELFSMNSDRLLSTDKFEISNDFINLPEKLKELVFSQVYYEGFSFGPTKVSSFMPAQELTSPDVIKLFSDIDEDVLSIEDIDNFSAGFKNLDSNLTVDDFAHMVFKRARWLFKEMSQDKINEFNLSEDAKKKRITTDSYVYTKDEKEAVLYKKTSGDPGSIEPVVAKYESSLSKLHKSKVDNQQSNIVKTDDFALIKDSKDPGAISSIGDDNVVVVFGVTSDEKSQSAFFVSKPKSASGKSASVFSHNTELYSSESITNADRGIFPIETIENDENFVVVNSVFNDNASDQPGKELTVLRRDFSSRINKSNSIASRVVRKTVSGAISAIDNKLSKMLDSGELVNKYKNLNVLMPDTSELRSRFFTSLGENISKVNDYLSIVKNKISDIIDSSGGISDLQLKNVLSDSKSNVFDTDRSIEYYTKRMLEGINDYLGKNNQELMTQTEFDDYIKTQYGDAEFNSMMKHNDIVLDDPSSKEYKDLTEGFASQIGC